MDMRLLGPTLRVSRTPHAVVRNVQVRVELKVKVRFTPEQAVEAQRGGGVEVLL
jgi:hypothetical protein